MTDLSVEFKHNIDPQDKHCMYMLRSVMRLEYGILFKNQDFLMQKLDRLYLVVTVETAKLWQFAKDNKKAHWLKAQPLKDFILGRSPSVNRKLLTHILKMYPQPTHPPTHRHLSWVITISSAYGCA